MFEDHKLVHVDFKAAIEPSRFISDTNWCLEIIRQVCERSAEQRIAKALEFVLK